MDAAELLDPAFWCKSCPKMQGESGWPREAKTKSSAEGEGQDAEARRAERVFFLVLAIVIIAEITAIVVLLR